MIGLHNFSTKARKIFHNDKVVQAEVVPVLDVVVKEVTSLSSTERGEGGIGSTKN